MTLIARQGPAWIRIDYHQFFLMEPEHQDFVPEEAEQLISPTGEAAIVHVGIAGGNAPDLPVLTPAGPGLYRVRAHARGRDIVYDGCESRSQEVYLFQIWSAPYCRSQVLPKVHRSDCSGGCDRGE